MSTQGAVALSTRCSSIDSLSVTGASCSQQQRVPGGVFQQKPTCMREAAGWPCRSAAHVQSKGKQRSSAQLL